MTHIAHMYIIHVYTHTIISFNEGADDHLDKTELKRMLTQLNDGYPPSDIQLDEVCTLHLIGSLFLVIGLFF